MQHQMKCTLIAQVAVNPTIWGELIDKLFATSSVTSLNIKVLKWLTKKYHTVGSVPKYNREMTEDDNIDIPNTHALW